MLSFVSHLTLISSEYTYQQYVLRFIAASTVQAHPSSPFYPMVPAMYYVMAVGIPIEPFHDQNEGRKVR